MSISRIATVPTARVDQVAPARDPARATEAGKGSFGDVVAKTLDSLQGLQAQADARAVDYAAGGQTELHDVMIAMEEANLGFQLTLQVRNKVVEAYQEIMRMQV